MGSGILAGLPYRRAIAHDFEFAAPGDGDRPAPHTYVARDLRSGAEVRLLGDDLHRRASSPFPVDDETLYISYYGSAEAACFAALGWAQPRHHLDLFVEHRAATNGMKLATGNDLLGALALRGIDGVEAAEKESMRQLGRRGPPYSNAEWRALSDYCASDVDALERLLPVMLSQIDLPRAVLRGRYMLAAGQIEFNGIPMDTELLNRLEIRLPLIAEELIRDVDRGYGVFDGTTFKLDRWTKWVEDHGIAWPTLKSGVLALDEETFRDMARADPRNPCDVEPNARETTARGVRWLQSCDHVGLSGQDQQEPAEQRGVCVRSTCVDAPPDSATARIWVCLHRLGATRMDDRGGPFGG